MKRTPCATCRCHTVRRYTTIGMASPWLTIGDVFLFLEPIHPFEADDNVVLDELCESAEYWREALS